MWFAFKFYIFDILIQQTNTQLSTYLGCDLLSNFISLIFWYNLSKLHRNVKLVVICFQILYLWYSDTTIYDVLTKLYGLWFAFKFYIFDILIQRKALASQQNAGCDLLSNFISLIFWYNFDNKHLDLWLVVICFQILYLWYSDTT